MSASLPFVKKIICRNKCHIVSWDKEFYFSGRAVESRVAFVSHPVVKDRPPAPLPKLKHGWPEITAANPRSDTAALFEGFWKHDIGLFIGLTEISGAFQATASQHPQRFEKRTFQPRSQRRKMPIQYTAQTTASAVTVSLTSAGLVNIGRGFSRRHENKAVRLHWCHKLICCARRSVRVIGVSPLWTSHGKRLESRNQIKYCNSVIWKRGAHHRYA